MHIREFTLNGVDSGIRSRKIGLISRICITNVARRLLGIVVRFLVRQEVVSNWTGEFRTGE